ncbi:hypothetical protein Trebr_0297 [Treponema brennaborense DSM 12168]|uniref:Glycosyltransferase RgtA/B/C/D-like domain-containing protein n=1 Tax=Treponema brennaborense (strain DSM 12168 / CIP 105900 / DD5/3) TaxID=906968 RepID=F4LMI3_TREBD|nr:hypothetical protein Trebr_0297 [Treponema brennaborense DSM 12168]
MKEFSKKANIILLSLSFLGLILGSLLILFSNNLVNDIQTVLETKIFHRTFDITKWADTITSLIAFPLFTVIALDAVLFFKFPVKSKIVLLSALFVLCAFFTLFCSYTRGNQVIDSDMASEILLAKECFLKKSFWPRSWNYSTEIRLLNTQILTAPVFAFTSNWFLVKTISGLMLCLLLPLALLFLLSQLKIRSVWMRLLSCLLIFCPWSGEMWRIVQFGNYYIPHIAIGFVYVGLFLALAYSELSVKKHHIFLITFFIVAFVSGLSGIRYILYFQFPLTVTILGYAVSSSVRAKVPYRFSSFFIKNKPTFYSCGGLLLGGVGYIANNLILSKLFTFSQFNTTAFNTIGDVTFTDVHRAVFEILGYKNGVSVFTPSGVTNILLYVALAFLIICFIDYFKIPLLTPRKVFVTFVIVMSVFNAFTYINTEYIARYFILILVYIVPCLALFLYEKDISALKRYMLGVSLAAVLICSSFITYETVLCTDNNTDKHEVAAFLQEQSYTFGYATFWNANVFTFMTNGKVEIANLYRKNDGGTDLITDRFKCDKWLTPERYYEDTERNDEKVFLLVTNDEYDASSDLRIFQTGKRVYTDDFYQVFEYANNTVFKNGF